jgi:dihydropyrimidine dehydrogenase (NAD+) subunit PreA
VEKTTRWVREVAGSLPVFTKLTPNITDIVIPAEAARRGGADGVALINTVNSIVSVDLDAMSPTPIVDGKGTHGGYCGTAVKPIALNMVAALARDPETAPLAISAIGGVTTWRDAAEFISLGAGNVQVCTAAMLYGFRIVEDMIDGLSNFMQQRQYRSIADFRGRAVRNTVDWNDLNMNYDLKAFIHQDLCIECGRCHIACEDAAHQAIAIGAKNIGSGPGGGRTFTVDNGECVGCNLCQHVCPVDNCIEMKPVANGLPPLTWPEHPRNPMRKGGAILT